MGYNKDNFKRIREEYATKTFRAQEEADLRRAELYAAIPAVREMDQQLSAFGLRIMQTALNSGNTEAGIAALREENERICRARVDLLRKHGYPANYSEPQYECEACKDTGYVGIKMCVCMRQKLTEAGMASSGLSGLMHKQSFENFSLEYYKQNPEHSRIMKQIFDYTVRYAKEFTIEKGKPMPKSLLFLGDTGLGKTHLSTAIAREIIARGYDVYYNSAVGMISDFEYLRFGNSVAATEATDTARYTECDLLIIDDLGTEVVNQFTVSCLYHVINTRLNLGKPTIISSNLKASELKTTYNERLSSRFKGEYVVLSFCGVDVRKQKIKQ